MHISLAETNSGIYKIENVFNKKCYVGSAVSLRIRWNKHKNDLCKNIHVNKHLQSAWNKYGKECFNFDVIECVSEKSKLIEREQHYIDEINPSYNVCPTAGSTLGVKHSKEICQMFSVVSSFRRMKGVPKSAEQKQKMSASMKGKRNALGCSRSEETRRKIGLASLGRKHTEETREKMKLAWVKRMGEIRWKIDE